MNLYSLDLTIDAQTLASKAFLAMKRFDSTLLMGEAIQKMRERKPFDISFDRSDREAMLVRLIQLLEELDRMHILYEIIASNVPKSSHLWNPSIWTLADAISALKTCRQQARVREHKRREAEEWRKSPEGIASAAFFEQLNTIRNMVESHWENLGLDQLRQSEKDYVYVWYLYVEVNNGSFHQYFFNSAGDLALLTLSALQRLGLDQAHSILSDALQPFELCGGYSSNRAERCEILKALPEGVFVEVTKRFYEFNEDICAVALLQVARDYEQIQLNT